MLVLSLAVLTPAGLVACAGRTTGQAATGPEASSAHSRGAKETLRLETLVNAQRSRPDQLAMNAPRLVKIESRPAPTERSARGLDDVLTELLGKAGSTIPAPSTDPVPDADTGTPVADGGARTDADSGQAAATPIDALRAYARGRSRLLAGDPAGAIPDLEAATRLDPGAPAPWRTLGEAQWNAGRRSAAITSFRRAVELGLREPRPLWLAGRELARTGRPAEGLLLLVQARELAAEDTWLIPSIEADLAQVMWSEGYRKAGLTLLPSALRGLDSIPQNDRRRPEVGELQRRRGELWQRAGDWAVAEEDLLAADDAYQQASLAPLADPGALAMRRVDVLLRRGQSGLAAMLIVERLHASSGRLDPADRTLIAHLASTTEVGPALGEALDGLRSTLVAEKANPRVVNELTLTLASSVESDRAQMLLLDAMAGSPLDEDLFAALLDASERSGASADSPETARLIGRAVGDSSENARRAASVLTLRGSGLAGLLERLGTSSDSGSVACAVHIARGMGRHDRALEIARRAEGAGATLLFARAWAGLGAASFAEASASIASLEALPEPERSPAIIRELALVLSEAGRVRDAIALLTPAPTASAESATLLTLADLHLRISELATAEDLLRRVRAQDPGEEDAASVLFTLYSPRGPLADATKLATLVRELRAANATAWLLRVEQARELASRSLWPQAIALLDDLSRQNPEPPGVITTLAAVWERAAASAPEIAARGEDSLRATLERRPDAPLVVIAFSRLLAATGRATEGEAHLEAAFSRWPLPEWGAAREGIVADAMGQPERALELARARLESAPPTAANTIELADVLLRASRPSEAARALGERLPADTPLSAQQLARLTRMVSGLRPESFEADPASAGAVLRLFDIIVARGVTLAPDMALTRARLIAISRPDDTAAIISAIDALGDSLARSGAPAGSTPDPRRLAEARLTATVAVATTLGALEDPTPLLTLLGEVAQRDDGSPDLLYEWYRLSFVRGDLADCMRLVEGVRDPERLLNAISERSGGEFDLPDDPTEARATLAYALASSAHTLSRYDIAEALYRHTLTLRPNHPWTCNNLGYMLLEQERDLAEAERLITIAYETLSEEASVIDSLAWVRYKRGHVLDYVDENGNEVPGALSLLERAMQFGGVGDETIVDHFGDALWRADRSIEARRAWSEAQLYLRAQVESLEREAALARGENRPQQAGVESPLLTRLRRELEEVSRKIDALDQGLAPSVAPFAAGVPDPLRDQNANP